MKNKKDLKNDQYWAGILDHKELLDHFDNKIQDYFDDLRTTGLLSLYERAYRAYYGGRISNNSPGASLFESSKLIQAGKQGEKTRLKSNHHRNLIRHLHQLVTQQKPNIQARATNSDYKSQSQTILGNGLLDYYWREKNVANIIRDAAEIALAVYAESFVHAPWSDDEGDSQPTMNGPTPTGDVSYTILTPLEVIRDPSLQDSKNSQWCIVKSKENRWDLISKYTGSGLEEDILAADAHDPDDDTLPVSQFRGGNNPINEDMLDFFIFYHKKSKALPEGRLVMFLRDLVLFDGPLPYRNIPVRRLAAEQLYDTIYAYTVAWDSMGVQEAIDELHTTLMSNNKTFGIQSLWIKDTDKLQTSSIGGGMKLFKSEEMPASIQLTKSAPEAYDYLSMLKQEQGLLTGIPDTVRGNPEANLKSGNALALVVSQAIQFASGLEDAINRLVEELGTDLINNLRDFSRGPRVANIIGKSQRPFAKEFTADDLSQINRVVVDQVNPLSKTIAGRAEIANNLLQQGLLTDPEKYIMVLTTGQLDPVMEGPQEEMLNIRAENEELREGQPVTAVMTESHALHIREHKSVIENPEAKKNPQLIMSVLAHIQEHIQLARTMDPALAMILGQQPLPPPEMVNPGSQPQNPTPPVEQAANATPPVKMPNLPPNSPPEAQAAYSQVQPPPNVA